MEWVLSIVTQAFVAVISNALKINYIFRSAGHCFCCFRLGSVAYCQNHKATETATVMGLGKIKPFSY